MTPHIHVEHPPSYALTKEAPEWSRECWKAFVQAIDSSGYSRQQFAHWLVDAGLWDCQYSTAETKFNQCLSFTRPEKLGGSETWALMRHFRITGFLEWMCAEFGLEVRVIPTAEVQMQALVALTEEMAGLQRKLDVLSGSIWGQEPSPPTKADRHIAASRDRVPSFCRRD